MGQVLVLFFNTITKKCCFYNLKKIFQGPPHQRKNQLKIVNQYVIQIITQYIIKIVPQYIIYMAPWPMSFFGRLFGGSF